MDTDLTKRAREQIGGLRERMLARTPALRRDRRFRGHCRVLASSASDFVTGRGDPDRRRLFGHGLSPQLGTNKKPRQIAGASS
jgi:hypothetical protein